MKAEQMFMMRIDLDDLLSSSKDFSKSLWKGLSKEVHHLHQSFNISDLWNCFWQTSIWRMCARWVQKLLAEEQKQSVWHIITLELYNKNDHEFLSHIVTDGTLKHPLLTLLHRLNDNLLRHHLNIPTKTQLKHLSTRKPW